MFQRMLKSSPDRSSGNSGSTTKSLQGVPNVEDDQPMNPFTEIQLLTEHSDLIKFLVQIDEQRCCTGGDDHLIIVWDVHFGKRIHILDGHSRPITCLSVCLSSETSSTHKTPVLLSAASDKVICLWNADTGLLLKSLDEHGCTARAFAISTENQLVFCSGGENLCLWKITGELIDKTPKCEEDINHLLILRNKNIVAAADRVLLIYSSGACNNLALLNHLEKERELACHKETITCILEVNDSTFVSGSLDGTIILWSSETFCSVRYLSHMRNDYQGSENLYPYSVQHMLCIDGRYLVCAMGCGFCILDTRTKKHLTEVWNGHYLKILHMTFVFGGLLLATCSEDGSVRLWGNPASFSIANIDQDIDNNERELMTQLDRFLNKRSNKDGIEKEKQVKLELLGECLGHTGTVHKCINIGNEGFVSCGRDGIVIVWKDGLREEMRRNEIIRDLLYGASADV